MASVQDAEKVVSAGCFLGFYSWGVELRAGQVWIGLVCLTEGRFKGLVYN